MGDDEPTTTEAAGRADGAAERGRPRTNAAGLGWMPVTADAKTSSAPGAHNVESAPSSDGESPRSASISRTMLKPAKRRSTMNRCDFERLDVVKKVVANMSSSVSTSPSAAKGGAVPEADDLEEHPVLGLALAIKLKEAQDRWWQMRGIEVGKTYMHIVRGLGTVVVVGQAGGRVAVHFAEGDEKGEEHSYNEDGWTKMLATDSKRTGERVKWAMMRSAREFLSLRNEVTKQQKEALLEMHARWPQYIFTLPMTQRVLKRMAKQHDSIPLSTLEKGRGFVGEERVQHVVSLVERAALDQAMQLPVNGYPLICWSKRTGLVPSPFKRVYQELCRILPTHRLRAAVVKTIFLQARLARGVSNGSEKGMGDRVAQTTMGEEHLMRDLTRLQAKASRQQLYVTLDVDPTSAIGSVDLPHAKRHVNDFNPIKHEPIRLDLVKEVMKEKTMYHVGDDIARFVRNEAARIGSAAAADPAPASLLPSVSVQKHAAGDVKGTDACVLCSFKRTAPCAVLLCVPALLTTNPPCPPPPACALSRFAELDNFMKKRCQRHILHKRDAKSVRFNERLPNAFDVFPRAFYKMVTKRMVKCKPCRSSPFRKAFKQRIFSPPALKIFTDMFWWVWCSEFQPDSEAEQARLKTLISAHYVTLVCELDASAHGRKRALRSANVVGARRSKDLFFKFFPFALANAVIWGFYFHFPTMRTANLFHAEFKWRVYSDTFVLLTGVDAAPSTLRRMREILFSDEDTRSAEERAPSGGPGHKSRTYRSGPGAVPAALILHQRARTPMHHEESSLDGPRAVKAGRPHTTAGRSRSRRGSRSAAHRPPMVPGSQSAAKEGRRPHTSPTRRSRPLTRDNMPRIKPTASEALTKTEQNFLAERQRTIQRQEATLMALPEIASHAETSIPNESSQFRRYKVQMMEMFKGHQSPLTAAYLAPDHQALKKERMGFGP